MIVFYRIIAELPCLIGLLVAGTLAYHDKSAWVWSWFLLFAFCNIITGGPKASAHTSQHGDKP